MEKYNKINKKKEELINQLTTLNEDNEAIFLNDLNKATNDALKFICDASIEEYTSFFNEDQDKKAIAKKTGSNRRQSLEIVVEKIKYFIGRSNKYSLRFLIASVFIVFFSVAIIYVMNALKQEVYASDELWLYNLIDHESNLHSVLPSNTDEIIEYLTKPSPTINSSENTSESNKPTSTPDFIPTPSLNNTNEQLLLTNYIEYKKDSYYGFAALSYRNYKELVNYDIDESDLKELEVKWRNQLSLPLTTSIKQTVDAGSFSAVAILNDGEIKTAPSKEKSLYDDRWENVISIAVGKKRSIGILEDGGFITTDRKLDISEWKEWDYPTRKDVIQVVAGYDHVVVLRADGTVDACGVNGSGQCDVSNWTNIVAISTGDNFTVGLTLEGDILSTSNYINEQITKKREAAPNEWQDIRAIAAGGGTYDTNDDGTQISTGHILALRKDGKVVAAGHNSLGQCDVNEWQGVKAISAGLWHSVGLTENNEVLTVGGREGFKKIHDDAINNWKDIVAICAAWGYTIGVDKNGSCYAEGYSTSGLLDIIRDWKDVRISSSYIDSLN